MVIRRKGREMSASEGQDRDEFMTEALTSFEVLARVLHVKEARLQPTLDAIVAAARALSPGQEAGLIVLDAGKLIPQSATGRAPHLLDLLQQKTGSGPCIEAARQQTVIRIDETQEDTRWPEFLAEAQRCGVRSQLCVPLWVDERCLGTLSLYGEKPSVFTRHDEHITTLFATLAALALAEAQRTEQLRAALANRDLIGQAKGILMGRSGVTADDAFKCLTEVSQVTNVKLLTVAQHLVETGELLNVPRGRVRNAAG
jgi:GAF domain-containing protein